MRANHGHQALAGAISGSAVICGAAAGPLWATAFDLAAALATAGVAVRAVEETARERGLCARQVLSRASRTAADEKNAPLAAHAVEVVCRVRSGDPRALRSAAMLLGRATSAHARGLALQLFGSWCAPLRELTKLAAPLAAARAAVEGAELVRTMTSAVPPALPVLAGVPEEEAAPPRLAASSSGRSATNSSRATTSHPRKPGRRRHELH